MKRQLLKNLIKGLCVCLAVWVGVASCSEDDQAYDPYADWASRNSAYFEQVADSARRAIAEAKAQYGNEWEDHCEWRMYQSTTKSPNVAGDVRDSICVHIFGRGNGKGCPEWSDTVRVHYRGYLMPTQNMVNGELRDVHTVFSQSYYGNLDMQTAVPSKMGTSSSIAGFATALQYMHVGDNWLVYIPTELGYGSQEQTTIPAYSALTFHIVLVDYFKPEDEIPVWKSR